MKVARLVIGEKRWIFKGIFAAIRGRVRGSKNKTIFVDDITKVGKTWVEGSDEYSTFVGFLVLETKTICSKFIDNLAKP